MKLEHGPDGWTVTAPWLKEPKTFAHWEEAYRFAIKGHKLTA